MIPKAKRLCQGEAKKRFDKGAKMGEGPGAEKGGAGRERAARQGRGSAKAKGTRANRARERGAGKKAKREKADAG